MAKSINIKELSETQINALVGARAAEEYLGLYRGSMTYLRQVKRGPSYLQRGKHYFYQQKDLDAYLKEVRSFVEVPPAKK
jgi:GTP cyclohydrolase II